MLKQANENKEKKLTLTAKLTNMIIKKSYLKKYFTTLQEKIKLNVELNNGTSKDGLNVEDQELLHDLNDSDEESLFAESDASGPSGQKNEYDVQASHGSTNGFHAEFNNRESFEAENEKDEDGLDVDTEDVNDSISGKFLNQ